MRNDTLVKKLKTFNKKAKVSFIINKKIYGDSITNTQKLDFDTLKFLDIIESSNGDILIDLEDYTKRESRLFGDR